MKIISSPQCVTACSHKLRGFFALLLAASLTVQAADKPDSQGKEVTKLDGTKIFGLVEVTDDYTLRISSDSGIQNIPIALLGEKDFRKYGFSRDRSKDGRFWSEREKALEGEKGNSQKSESGDVEIQLAELAPFQPLIAAYESITPPKAADKEKDTKAGADAKNQANPPEKSPSLHLFTGPGSLAVPSAPFASGSANAVIQPAASAASSATGLAPGSLTQP